RETVPLAGLIEDANAIALVGTAKAISYSQDVDPSLKVDADPVQIQQVLINLVRNAAEAMEQSGERRLSVTAKREGDRVEICVQDSGPGIAQDSRAHLFEPFQSTKAAGMGIGLSICRTIVEAHQGRIWLADDGEGAGASFRFTLSLAA
ncbi:MAG: two-component system, LuxR family, sensor kinase FixL, partial [Sphingomonadales bacterium]|nr:two-component system, LuxR family, sensor kinase FixL [Sphingomonadales bacterium]